MRLIWQRSVVRSRTDEENQGDSLERPVDGNRHIFVKRARGSEYESQEYQK